MTDAERRGEVFDHIQQGYASAENVGEFLWAVAQAITDEAEHGEVYAYALERLSPLIEELWLIARTQAVIDAASRFMPADRANELGRNFATAMVCSDGLSLGDLQRGAFEMVQHRADNFDLNVRDVDACADAMARAWL